MIVMGLDPSQSTGWAIYDTDAHVSAIRCGSLKIHAKTGAFEQNAGCLGAALVRLLKDQRDPETNKIILPDFAVVEQAPRRPYGGGKGKPGGPKTVRFMGEEVPAQEGEEASGSSPGLQGTLSTNQMAAALCSVLGAYGIPFVTVTDSAWRSRAYGFGKKAGWARPQWKKHARQMCDQMRIVATNDDMAEACWIAFIGPSLPEFKHLQHQRRAA